MPMTYPLFSLAKCSTHKAVSALECGADRLDKALDRLNDRIDKTVDCVVDRVDQVISSLEGNSYYLAPTPKSNMQNKVLMQKRMQMKQMQQQKLNQMRAEAAVKRTAAARSAAARQHAMRRAMEQQKVTKRTVSKQTTNLATHPQGGLIMRQRAELERMQQGGAQYNTMNAGRTPMPSGVRRVYGANRNVSSKSRVNNEASVQAREAAEEARKVAKHITARKVAQQVCKDIEKSVVLTQKWASLVSDRVAVQNVLEARMIQKRAARRERDAALYSGDEEEIDEEASEVSESETDLDFVSESEDEEEEEEDEGAVANWEALVEARVAQQNAKANWEALVEARIAKQNANAAAWASLVDQKMAMKKVSVAGKWGKLAEKLTGRHHYIGDFYPELENEMYAVDAEVETDSVVAERDIYYIGGETDGAETDVENQIGVLRETGAETGIETEAERWEYIGTSEAEDSDDDEEVPEEEKKVETSSRWWW